MKLLPSPSISSSSSSPSSFPFDPTSKSITAGCIAGILRRILRSRSIPTHPSDNISSSSADSHHEKFEVSEGIEEAKVVPGIVARLMGLDSVPEIRLLEDQVKSNSMMSRSKSTNSVEMECLGKESDRVEEKLRRVKSTISLSEIPIFFQQEDDEFLVLSFEKEGEGSEKAKQRKKQRKGKKNRAKKTLSVLIEEEVNLRTAENCEKFEDLSSEIVLNEANSRKKKTKGVNGGVMESLEQESSPISVLEFHQTDTETNPECDQDEEMKLDSRRKLSPELENCGSIPNSRDKDFLMDSDRTDLNCIQDVIYKLTETELCKSTWFNFKTFNYGEAKEDIIAEFQSQILDCMLDELVVHLSDFRI